MNYPFFWYCKYILEEFYPFYYKYSAISAESLVKIEKKFFLKNLYFLLNENEEKISQQKFLKKYKNELNFFNNLKNKNNKFNNKNRLKNKNKYFLFFENKVNYFEDLCKKEYKILIKLLKNYLLAYEEFKIIKKELTKREKDLIFQSYYLFNKFIYYYALINVYIFTPKKFINLLLTGIKYLENSVYTLYKNLIIIKSRITPEYEKIIEERIYIVDDLEDLIKNTDKIIEYYNKNS